MLSPHVLPRGTHCSGLGDESYIESIRGTDMGLDKAFLASYLLTGNIEQAEAAVLLAMKSWKRESESGEYLFRKILQTAAGTSIEQTAFAAAYHLPSQLENVLKLTGPLRRSFVLRILIGLPAGVCAELLNIGSQLVDAHLRYALVCLGDSASDPGKGCHGEAYLS